MIQAVPLESLQQALGLGDQLCLFPEPQQVYFWVFLTFVLT